MTELKKPGEWTADHWNTLLQAEECAVGNQGEMHRNHWSVMYDLACAGLLAYAHPMRDGQPDRGKCHVELLDRGWAWVGFVRRWKAQGKYLEDLTAAHVTRTDRESVNAMARSLLGGNTRLDAALYQAGVSGVSEDLYRGLLRVSEPSIHTCVECGEWVEIDKTREDLCDTCFNILVDLNSEDAEEEEDDYEFYDLSEDGWANTY